MYLVSRHTATGGGKPSATGPGRAPVTSELCVVSCTLYCATALAHHCSLLWGSKKRPRGLDPETRRERFTRPWHLASRDPSTCYLRSGPSSVDHNWADCTLHRVPPTGRTPRPQTSHKPFTRRLQQRERGSRKGPYTACPSLASPNAHGVAWRTLHDTWAHANQCRGSAGDTRIRIGIRPHGATCS